MSHPVAHAIAEATTDGVGKDDEFLNGVAIVPATEFLQTLRQVPVIQRGPGLQPALEHAVDQT